MKLYIREDDTTLREIKNVTYISLYPRDSKNLSLLGEVIIRHLDGKVERTEYIPLSKIANLTVL